MKGRWNEWMNEWINEKINVKQAELKLISVVCLLHIV